MNDRQTFSDRDLTAYLDGVVDQDQKMEIESALAHDPALVDRLDRLSLDTGSISAAFTHLLSQSPEAPSFLDADAGAGAIALADALNGVCQFGAVTGSCKKAQGAFPIHGGLALGFILFQQS